ncbi:hypothetical protein shim_23740 [Shimia sp. SK013]|uniref:hypothetical protein n=1 Tax=Shimia sp. SK013 TaxID=1389006 RepID=UPI0006B6967A|nr:hypothetical protein [Shimia sp. SK013]KPA21667.1 hypothetical protein shim_23740 [Shimia sp. SK013]
MKHFKLKMAMAFGLLIMAATHSEAQENCAARDTVLAHLAERYGETRQAIGIAQQGAVIEVFASETSGSWTITVTSPSGDTCLVASGQAYEDLAEALPSQDDGA